MDTMQHTESPAFGDLLGEPRKLKSLSAEERASRVAFFGRRIDAALRRGAARDLILSGSARYARIEGEAKPRLIRLVMDDKAGPTQLQLDDADEFGLIVSLDRVDDAYIHAREVQIAMEVAQRVGLL